MAIAVVRLGALLSDMYMSGYIMDKDNNLRLDRQQTIGKSTLSYDQKRILDRAILKLLKGLALYKKLEEERIADEYNNVNEYNDNRMNIADASNYIGIAYGHQLQWEEAILPLQDSLVIYNTLLDEYQSMEDVDGAVEVSTSMISTSQSLWEALLHIPDATIPAAHIFRQHLDLHQHIESQIPMHQPLHDDEEYDDSYHNDLFYSINCEDEEFYEETLNEYQTSLDEHLKLKSELPPDGSYYDIGFDADVTASTVELDNVYEGSIRSSLGTIYLAKCQTIKAKLELEMAVSLLREGSLNGEEREYLDRNGEPVSYSIELQLANSNVLTLMTLSYIYLGVRQFKSSFDAFEEAMDIYQSELKADETPMNHIDMPKNVRGSWGDKLTESIIRSSLEVEGDDAQGKDVNQEERESMSSTQDSISLDDYDMLGNDTRSEL